MKKPLLIKKLTAFLLLAMALPAAVNAQCPVTAFANPISIACGDTVNLTAVANGSKPLNNNFNSGSIGTDWQATTGAVVTNCTGTYSCVGSPSEGPYCLWMGATVAAPRNVTTNDYNLVSGGAISGTICFDLKYSTQAGPNPCEGIDLPAEGVSLQYSTNGGASWTTLKYWDPNGGYDPVMTVWTRYCISIPPAAFTAATRFRWYQTESSGAGFDTWGLDDMVITLNDPGYTYDWGHDSQGPSPSPYTPPVVPVNNTTFTVTYTNGTNTCTANVSVTVAAPTGTATASPAQVCVNGQSQLSVVASLVPPVPAVCGLSPTGCKGVSTIVNIGTGTVSETTFMPLGRASGGLNTCANGTGNYDDGCRTQMIIKASELPAYFRGGQMYNIAFTLIGVTAANFENFTISMGCTNKTQFAADNDFIGGLVTVFNAKTVALANGAKTFDFDRHFDWDGISNVVVQICFKASAGRTGNMQKTSTPGFYSTIHAYGCQSPGCTETRSAKRFLLRPSIKLGICYRPLPSISYTWSPSTGLSSSSIANPVATVSGTTTYTVTVADAARPMCIVTKSVVIQAVSPSVSVNPSTATVCNTGPTSVLITATGTPSVAGGSITSYAWSPPAGLSSTTTANPTASPTTNTTYVVTVTDNLGCTSTTNVIVSYCVAIPVELLSFTARKKGGDVLLTWSTATEINIGHFAIEQSADGVNYTSIGTVPATGNSYSTRQYTMLDQNPNTDMNFYRLKVLDRDGNLENTKLALINFSKDVLPFDLGRISPVPVKNSLNFTIMHPHEGSLEFRIFSITGQLVKSQAMPVVTGNNMLTMDVNEIAEGIYFLQAYSSSLGEIRNEKFIVRGK